MFLTNFVAARSLPGILCAASGHYDEESNEQEHQGAAAKPPADRKHGELPLYSSQELQKLKKYSQNNWI